MEKYIIFERLGVGGQGATYRAIHKQTCEIVVLKNYFTSVHYGNTQPHRDIAIEISALTSLKHLNIVQIYEVICKERWGGHYDIWIVLEALDCDLGHYMDRGRSFRIKVSPVMVKRFCYSMLHALNVCHKNNFVHRDVKPGNLLFDGKRQIVKLADFGHSTTFVDKLRREGRFGTLSYRAPELLLKTRTYTTAVDIWGAGCVFAEMVIGRALFRGSDEEQLLSHIFAYTGFPNKSELDGRRPPKTMRQQTEVLPPESLENIFAEIKGLGPHGISLLKKMLERDPRKRITAKDALGSEYFRDFRKSS